MSVRIFVTCKFHEMDFVDIVVRPALGFGSERPSEFKMGVCSTKTILEWYVINSLYIFVSILYGSKHFASLFFHVCKIK